LAGVYNETAHVIMLVGGVAVAWPRASAMERTMITGMHAVIYTRDAKADRAFFRDVLGLPSVDAGDGWLIFAAPPSELACHPAESNGKHELYLMCDDLQAEIARLGKKGIRCGSVSDEGWGILSTVRLPGGGDLGLYEPRHAMAHGSGN
jgi:catechol 2,3-dioxygenase-like lactoylglutathione lyase family enzyme